jgi:hypothetical protein
MKKLIGVGVTTMLVAFVVGASPVAAEMFSITYYDNFNNSTGSWDSWEAGVAGSSPKYLWDSDYAVDWSTGNTVATSHYLTEMAQFDLRGGYTSLDGHAAGDEDWNPLRSVGDTVSGQSAHHVFGATITGLVHFSVGDVLRLESDDDGYVFLDGDTAWGQEILSQPTIAFFGVDEITIDAALAGTHLMTVKFAERADIHSGIQINLNGEAIQAVPVPGAALLGLLGMGTAGWRLRRRK